MTNKRSIKKPFESLIDERKENNWFAKANRKGNMDHIYDHGNSPESELAAHFEYWNKSIPVTHNVERLGHIIYNIRYKDWNCGPASKYDIIKYIASDQWRVCIAFPVIALITFCFEIVFPIYSSTLKF